MYQAERALAVEYEDYTDRASIVRTVIDMTVMATVMVVPRVWARRTKGVQLGVDNGLAIIAFVYRDSTIMIPVSENRS